MASEQETITEFFVSGRWLEVSFLGNQVWQYILLFFCILGAIVLAKIVDTLLCKYLRRLAARTQNQWDDMVINILRGPLKVIVFIALLHTGIKVMNKPEWLENYLERGFGLTVGIALTYCVIKSIDVGFEVSKARYTHGDRRINYQILIILRKAAKVFVIVTAVLVAADNNGIKITSVLAGLGVTGLAVALASQETLSNLLGSIVILADRPFVVGDRIKLGADEGVVEYIGIRSTRLRTTENDIISIPNRNITGASVRNFSKTTEQLTQQPPQPKA